VAISPGPQSTSQRIDFQGNDRISSGDLRQAVEAREQDVSIWLEPEAIETTIEALYRSRGHLNADVTVEARRFENGAAILPVRIDEGPAYRIGIVGVSGAAFRTADAVRAVTGLESGGPYRPADVEPARRRVEVDYLDAGYNDVSVSTIVGIDEERAVADVVFAIAEGPQQILQDVAVTGSRVTSGGTITRALDLDQGEPLDMSDVYAAQKRLYDTSVFRTVNIEVEPIEGAVSAPGTQAVRALVNLQELPRYRFRYGFRVSDSPGPAEETHQVRPALVADLLDRNVFGRAITTGVAGQVESHRRLVRGIVSLPTLWRLPIVTNVFVTHSRESFGDADEDLTPYVDAVIDLTFEQRMKPARTMAVTWGYTFSRQHTFETDPDPDNPFALDERYDVARLTSTYAWDTRDDPSDSTRGWFHSSSLEYATAQLGSDLRFVRFLTQQYYFHRVGNHAVLASAFRVGLGRGFGQDLIPSERFFTGGGTSVRGFAEDAVGGRDFLGFPNGGASLVQFNQEVRFPIYRWFRGVGFFDAGNVFPTVRDLTFTDLERGAGLGLRINSPFATIRIDYGVPLTNRDSQRARWYFGIGQTF
jgi:outer membrane protein assembly complex protein YaeT